MTLHIKNHRDGFDPGQTSITRYDDADDSALISLDVLKLAAGEAFSVTTEYETAWLLMSGKVSGTAGGDQFDFKRNSLFDESSSCVHVSAIRESSSAARPIRSSRSTLATTNYRLHRAPFIQRTSPMSRAAKVRSATVACAMYGRFLTIRTPIQTQDSFSARSLHFKVVGRATRRTIIRSPRYITTGLPSRKAMDMLNSARPS